MMELLVYCTMCDTPLLESEFSPSEITKLRTGRCRDCRRGVVRERYREYQKDPVRRRQLADKAREYKRSEKGRLAARRYREENAEKVAATNRAWKKVNPQSKANSRVQRRAQAIDKIQPGDLVRLMNRQRGLCYYCGEKLVTKHLEHVVPLSRGGRHTIGNVVYACARCNLSKGTKFLVEWRAPIGR